MADDLMQGAGPDPLVEVTVAEARQLLLRAGDPVGVESISLDDALGRVVARDVAAPIDLPSFPTSAMDGYAVRSLDLNGAAQTNPVRLRVVGSVYAGEIPAGPLSAGEAITIATGAALPDGADAVVPKERAERLAEAILCCDAVEAGTHVRPVGEDMRSGRLITRRGCVLGPSHLMALASLGIHELAVFRRPRVGLLSIGSELMEPGAPAAPYKVYNASRAPLAAYASMCGAEVVSLRSIADDLDLIAKEYTHLAEVADIVVSTGGVSVGDRDLVVPALQEIGARLHFRKVLIKPGKPLTAASLADVPIVALSGNPFPALVTFWLFVQPLLKKMAGTGEVLGAAGEVEAICDCDFDRPASVPRYLWGRLYLARGVCRVEVFHDRRRGRLDRAVEANCLVRIDPSMTVRPGSKVRCIPIADKEGGIV